MSKGETRCVDGRLMRHDPQFDDPYLETDIGKCPDCSGDGCVTQRKITFPPFRTRLAGGG